MRWLEQHWYRITPISFLLLPISWVYCLLVAIRRMLYRTGVLPTVSLAVPVVVVGNLTVGGSGKTPLVLWLAGYLRAQGMHPGIILRGYGGSAVDWPQDVSLRHDADVVGDEAVLLARQSHCPVVADPDRVRGAQHLIAIHHCDIILSDDGLQHFRLGRNIEIVVIDGERRFGNGYCLPAGPLRESVGRLRDVDLVITQGIPREKEFGMMLVETGLCRVNLPQSYASAGAFKGETVHAVAGIGNPRRFFKHLQRLGVEVIPHPFPDHHRFRSADIDFPDNRPVIMTQKDAVKCERIAGDHVWYLAVEAKPDMEFADTLMSLLKEKRRG